MAKDQFSFDIVSEVDTQEVRNAVDQASREIANRYDFKGSSARVERTGDTLMVYHYMFPRHSGDQRAGPTRGVFAERALSEGPCPSCTALIDGKPRSATVVTRTQCRVLPIDASQFDALIRELPMFSYYVMTALA
mgnify:CR=1 FL=1